MVRLERRTFLICAALVLVLAAVNVFFRLGREFVTEWDESLYAISAQEMVASRNWIRVTFLGAVDYYNTKPPLNIWLIALAFETLGRSLLSLRIVSAISAWLTVAILVAWARRPYGDAVSIVAGVVLATTFGFLHVHSGRSANTDAIFTLLLLLTVVTLWSERRQPWHRVWLGPLLAAAFMLRGPAFLMPLALVLLVFVWRRLPFRILPTLTALALFFAPVAAWGFARYTIDRWEFIERMYSFDFVARTTRVLDGHPGGPLYYLSILGKHQYDWLAAGAIAALLFPPSREHLRSWFRAWRRNDDERTILGAWAAVALVIPTLMLTKLPWYLNTFYPLFALVVARLLVRGLALGWTHSAARARTVTLAIVAALAFTVAEAKIWSYSVGYRDLNRSAQGLLLSEAKRFAGRSVFRDRFDRSATFVGGLVGVQLRTALTFDDFMRHSQPGDFLLISGQDQGAFEHASLMLVAANRGNRLYQRVEELSR